MQWHGFLDTAERLAKGNTQGDWRSATSRAYYAVFHFFREFFLAHGLNVGTSGQSHFNIYTGLLHCGDPKVAKLGSDVDRLRVQRVIADYDLRSIYDAKQANKVVRDARGVITAFQALQSTAPANIVAGARKHLQVIGKLGKSP
jgi:uncharacterized protein (UPF0332 family)